MKVLYQWEVACFAAPAKCRHQSVILAFFFCTEAESEGNRRRCRRAVERTSSVGLSENAHMLHVEECFTHSVPAEARL